MDCDKERIYLILEEETRKRARGDDQSHLAFPGDGEQTAASYRLSSSNAALTDQWPAVSDTLAPEKGQDAFSIRLCRITLFSHCAREANLSAAIAAV